MTKISAFILLAVVLCQLIFVAESRYRKFSPRRNLFKRADVSQVTNTKIELFTCYCLRIDCIILFNKFECLHCCRKKSLIPTTMVFI